MFCSLSLHFRTDNYSGFYIALLLQAFLGFVYAFWLLTVLLFYVSLYHCAVTLTIDLTGLAFDLNTSVSKHFKKKKGAQTTKLILKDMIDLHTDLLKYVRKKFDKYMNKTN